MFTELRVRNLALIAAAELELGSGLTVLSGETGAGKTALLASLKLLVGERADSVMVGSSANEIRVEAVVDCIAEEDAEEDEIEHLIVRRITSEGRSRCYLDDSLVTVSRLGSALGPFVDLYGQHEHQSLLKTSEQIRILDAYGGESVAAALRTYDQTLQSFKAAKSMLDELIELSQSSSAAREQAAFVLREITKIAPKPDEYESLEQELPRLQNGEQLAEAANTALELLRGEGGVIEQLSKATRALEALRGIDKALDEPLEQMTESFIGLEEAAADIGRYAASIEYDPIKLQIALDRLGELDGLSRRFGPGMAQVFSLAERSEQLLKNTEDIEGSIKDAEVRLCDSKSSLEAAAESLAKERAKAAEGFLAELNSSIADLALTGASLEFSVQDLAFDKWTQGGSQHYELLYSPAPSAAARPLAKIASGGELSRVMLAIKSLLQTNEKPMTLVFDEIDAGIGGKTANAVAERLADLAKCHQVIVITHLAQIAAMADHHFLVSKANEEGEAITTITTLAREARITEIARMLSGSEDVEALAHAEKLLKEAGK